MKCGSIITLSSANNIALFNDYSFHCNRLKDRKRVGKQDYKWILQSEFVECLMLEAFTVIEWFLFCSFNNT